MADNVVLDPGAGGSTIAADDIAGVWHPRGKLSLGSDGSATDAVGGAGTVSAAVMRTTLASDDPAVVAVQLIDDGIATVAAAVPTKGMAAAGTDGTNARLLKTDASGELQVDVLTLPSVTIGAAIPAGTNNIGDVDVLTLPAVTNGGTFAVQESGAALTALQLIDDPVGATAAAIPAKGMAALGTDGTNGRILKTDTAGELQVDVLTLPNVTIGAALPAGANNIGDVDVASIAAGDNNIGNVDIVTMPTVTETNSAAALTALQLLDDTIFVDEAAFTVASSKVSASGLMAVAHGADPDAAAAGGAVIALANRHRVPFVIGGHPNIISTEYVWTTGQTDDPIVTISTGSKIIVTQVQVMIDAACTVAVGIRMGFGTANVPTTPADGGQVAGMIVSHPGMVPGSGLSRGDGSGILAIGADNEDLRVTTTAPTTGSGRAMISYYLVPT